MAVEMLTEYAFIALCTKLFYQVTEQSEKCNCWRIDLLIYGKEYEIYGKRKLKEFL